MRWRRLLGVAPGHQRRRGAIAVQVAIAMTAVMAFTALSFDVGVMYNNKAELQRTVDAAALAAASRLAAYDEGDVIALARKEAEEYIAQNQVFGAQLVAADSDIEFGRAIWSDANGGYNFMVTSSYPDAVRVRLRMTEGSPNGPLDLYFAKVLGYDHAELEAEAIAMMVPRDIAVVADLSGSHTDDSEFSHYKSTTINLLQVWDGLPGGIDDGAGSMWNGDEFAVDGDGWSPQMAGPAWGLMKALGFGDEVITSSYDPRNDPGLTYLPYNSNWKYNSSVDRSLIQTYMQAQGYSNDEVNALMASDYDSSGGYWTRVAVALGLATWNSGMPGGRWQTVGASPGNGNGWVGEGEIDWQENFGARTDSQSQAIFKDYINSYMRSSSTGMTRANGYLRERFGVKTFTNYLLERRPEHHNTPELAQSKTQPMQAVKDAVTHMCDLIESLDTNDQVSLEIYGETARHEVDLTFNYAEVKNRLNDMQAGHYDTWTNMGGGITRGIEELTNNNSGADNARHIARKVMIVLTDGRANVTEDGRTGDYYNGPVYAREAAQNAADQGIMIFTVSVGVDADTSLMSDIASMGSGTHFHAEGSIDDYSAQLEEIFRRLGGTRPVELIR